MMSNNKYVEVTDIIKTSANTSHFEYVNLGVENSAINTLLSLIKQCHEEVLVLQPIYVLT